MAQIAIEVLMDRKEMNKILYLCDTKDCCTSCNHTECKHTSNIEHATNFERKIDGSYWEKEQSKFEESRKTKIIILDAIVLATIAAIAQLISNDLQISIILATGLITGYIIGLFNN